MAKIERYEPGTFCWAELATNDGPAAKRFYMELFGWTARDNPMGPDQVYTVYEKNGDAVGAQYQMAGDAAERGLPRRWNSYVSVASADATASKVKAAGGTVLSPPFDVMEAGRMAVLQDPAGAIVCAWEPRRDIGARVVNEPGAPCWNECLTNDPAGAARFYGSVFGWTTKQDPATAPYVEFFNGNRAAGGMLKIAAEWGPMPPHWVVYFAVEDCDRAATRANELGGDVRVPPTDIPDVGRFATILDPQGSVFAVVRLTGALAG